jgi:hypothetical protein
MDFAIAGSVLTIVSGWTGQVNQAEAPKAVSQLSARGCYTWAFLPWPDSLNG